MTDTPDTSSADDLVRWSFLVLFAKDDVLDEEEFEFLERLALRDGMIDENEREVLQHIFDRVDLADMEPDVVQEVNDFRREYGID